MKSSSRNGTNFSAGSTASPQTSAGKFNAFEMSTQLPTNIDLMQKDEKDHRAHENQAFCRHSRCNIGEGGRTGPLKPHLDEDAELFICGKCL
mmetsp:Transcript_16436/g.38603  ORF Transcript_16436/g.38603 Transcript_16436/m.38603 type:complete len:92 (+) Transcript_16436:641-916(+)